MLCRELSDQWRLQIGRLGKSTWGVTLEGPEETSSGNTKGRVNQREGTASAEALKSEGTWCVQRRKPSIVCKRKSIRR